MSRRLLRSAAVLGVTILFALPIAFMILGALRQPGLPPPDGFDWIPDQLRWSNFQTVFDLVSLWPYIGNSLVVALVAVPVTVLVASLAGFAVATADHRSRRWIVIVSLVALMTPTTALWIPRFVMFRWSGLIDTPFVLMVPALMATTPFFVLIFAVVYSRIPKQLFEAAALEGSSPLATWRRVALPLGRPATFAVAVLALVWHWANFIDPLLYLTREERFTLPLALRTLQTLEPTMHPLMLAAAVIATAIPLLLFFVAQRAFFVKTLDV